MGEKGGKGGILRTQSKLPPRARSSFHLGRFQAGRVNNWIMVMVLSFWNPPEHGQQTRDKQVERVNLHDVLLRAARFLLRRGVLDGQL
eukprot:1729794-Amphidinium_carterae.1